jgi:metal-responsive CopG/Arc/MetJ family transcriptional regulator
MKRITVSLEEEQVDLLDELSSDDGPCDNRSESMRFVIAEYEADRELDERIEELEERERDLENRLEESRRREIARDKTQQEIDTLREELHETRDERDAPFFVRWYRWYRRRG